MENKLLSFTELEEILNSVSPVDVADIIAPYFKDKIIYHSNKCYVINKNMIYEDKTGELGDILLTDVSKLILNSYRNLDESKKNEIIHKELKSKHKLFENKDIKKYIPQLITNLTNNDIKFDSYLNIIHFLNGYYNLELKQFFHRRLGEHYITNCINHEYKKSNDSDKRKIYKELKKIYHKKDILDAMLTIIGSALTGQAIRGSYILFLLGNASAGKSTLLDISKSSFGCYVKQIKPDTFVEGKNQDKIVNTYCKGSYIRITWLNEPKDKSFDTAFLKSWADGECNAEKLYQEGSHDFKHYSLTIFTANTMPRLKLDGGVKRRIRALEHKSKFTPNKNEVNEEAHVYYADEDFKNNFDDNINMKLAFFNLIAEYAYDWLLQSKKIDLPEEFTETTNNVLESNDIIKDFIDGNLTITDDEKDKIGKNKMLEIFNKAYPNKHFEVTQLTTLLKEKGLKYNRQLRYNNIQGSFYGVRLKQDLDDPKELDLTIEQQIESLENQKYGIEQQILKLKQQLPTNKKEEDIKPEPKEEPQEEPKEEPKEDDKLVKIKKPKIEKQTNEEKETASKYIREGDLYVNIETNNKYEFEKDKPIVFNDVENAFNNDFSNIRNYFNV